MFSPRFVAGLAILATVAALPATNKSDEKSVVRPVLQITDVDDPFSDDTPWFSFPSISNLFAPLWRLLPSFSELGPRIVNDEKEFKITVNVKDYKTKDLKVKVKGDFIFVQGSHEAKKEDRDIFASQFFHTYTLPVNSSGADVTAALTSDGYLVVTAPINGPSQKDENIDREVPIVETGAPLPKEDTKKPKEEITTLAPTTENDNDRKEPTTPSTSDAEKENKIPHGNNEVL